MTRADLLKPLVDSISDSKDIGAQGVKTRLPRFIWLTARGFRSNNEVSDIHREKIQADRGERTQRDLRAGRRRERISIANKITELIEEPAISRIIYCGAAINVMNEYFDRGHGLVHPSPSRREEAQFCIVARNFIQMTQIDDKNRVAAFECPGLKRLDPLGLVIPQDVKR